MSLKETHNSLKIQPLDFEKKSIAQNSKKCFFKVPTNARALCHFANLFTPLFHFEGRLEIFYSLNVVSLSLMLMQFLYDCIWRLYYYFIWYRIVDLDYL